MIVVLEVPLQCTELFLLNACFDAYLHYPKAREVPSRIIGKSSQQE